MKVSEKFYPVRHQNITTKSFHTNENQQYVQKLEVSNGYPSTLH